ncbi:uncharacterized protein LOC123520567 isoform X2 [Portunus trituberculatus]|nr:uncharacterized protein LOC123520567 isoform X2 [Portunus trituberculatus]
MASLVPLMRLVPLRAPRATLRPCYRLHRQLALASYRYKSTKASEEEIDLDEPLKFSTSRAATWKARDTYGSMVTEDKMPWYQPYVVALSLSTFLLYFCVLREENDVDTSLRMSLYDRIEGLEEKQLELTLEEYIQSGKDTAPVRERLKEIRESKSD